MAITQRRPVQQESGKKYKKDRRKKLYEMGRRPALTKVGETSKKSLRTRGGDKKTIILEADSVNIFDKKDKKFKRLPIKNVLENSANRNFVRRNILTRGTVIETELGKARITSRPGQVGSLEAVLI